MPDGNRFDAQVEALQDAYARLTGRIVALETRRGALTPARFFRRVKDELDDLCRAIASTVEADTCAIFFLDEEGAPFKHQMIMRAACGNFSAVCRSGRKNPATRDGYSYESLLKHAVGKAPSAAQDIVRRWPVTNQVWHLGIGMLANSNRALKVLAHRPKHHGMGDDRNYPNLGRLSSVFRNTVQVPIYGRGGESRVLIDPFQTEPWYGALRNRGEFAAQYRVVGILKVEGKRPKRFEPADGDRFVEQCPPKSRPRLAWWLERRKRAAGEAAAMEALRGLFDADGPPPTVDDYLLLNRPDDDAPDFSTAEAERLVEASASVDEIKRRLPKHVVDVDLVDYLTETFAAEFTQQDAELLVTMAMQIGRLMVRRTIERGHARKIMLSEYDAGALNIRYDDIDPLRALFTACDRLRERVGHLFEQLQDELNTKIEESVFETQVMHRVHPRKAVRSVSSRLKDAVSLFRKLGRKEHDFAHQTSIEARDGLWERRTHEERLTMHGVSLELVDARALDERQSVAAGRVRLYWGDRSGEPVARVGGDIGIAQGPQASFVAGQMPATVSSIEKDLRLEQPLVKRILEVYQVDDIAGVRVVCDYLDDLDRVIDEIRARATGWKLRLAKIDHSLEVGKPGGYRAVHITLVAEDVGELISEGDRRRLAALVNESGRIELPCEIQLRTTLEDGESLKSHAFFKGESDVEDRSYFDLLETQSNQLYEVERNSNLIRNRVEEMLMPSDFGRRRLLGFLRPRLTREGFALVEFGLAVADQVHRDDLRLNGQPYISYLLAICRRLVHTFGVNDPEMLFLALVHDLWMRPTDPAYRKQTWVHVEAPLTGMTPDAKTAEAAVCLKYSQRQFASDLARALAYRSRPGGIDEKSYFAGVGANPGTKEFDALAAAFGDRLRLNDCFSQFRQWFWVLLGSFRRFWWDCYEGTLRDHPASAGWSRIHSIRHHIDNAEHRGAGRDQERDDWLERAFVLEAALLLGRLEELPHEANQKQAEEQYRRAYYELDLILENLPPVPIKMKVIEDTTKVFREIAREMEIEIPINWYR